MSERPKDTPADPQAPFQWRGDCRFELLIDGTEFFPRILQTIEQARHCIDIELYLVESGQATQRLVAALTAAAKRGVSVRCLFDAIGSVEFSAQERESLREANVDLRFYNPVSWRNGLGNLHRDHRKLLLFDRQIAFTGGLGISDLFCEEHQPEAERASAGTPWHDQMLIIEGTIVQDWQRLFEQSWQQATRPQRKILDSPPQKHAPVPLPDARPGLGRVAFSASRNNRDLLLSLVSRIRQAQTRVWLATPYFVPPRSLRRALIDAARRGIDVRIQVSGRYTIPYQVRYAGQIYYAQLLSAGVRIFEYQPRFLHLKTVLIDDWVSLGSCNFDHWTLHWNLEANQNALDPDLARTVKSSFEQDFKDSDEMTRQQWTQLPMRHRLSIWVWGRVKKLADLFLGT
ncbi:MAG: cardiolipin synthase B [Gammaproteobacteria bacterium]|mgnify:CR=1 FL=1|nr:cardiolipin synthase B [Gammaproteobacteria bacterium]